MQFFFKDRLRLDRLKLGLEVFGDVGARVGAAAWVGHAESEVFNLVAFAPPGWSLVGRMYVMEMSMQD
jgi:hypothetical protein